MTLKLILQHHQITSATQHWFKTQPAQYHNSSAETWPTQLKHILQQHPKQQRCQLRLGAPYVQWFISHWPNNIRQADLPAYLQYQAQQQLNLQQENSSAWRIAYSARARKGHNLLIAAIDHSHIEQCQQIIQASGKRLLTLQPLLLTHWPKRLLARPNTLLAFHETHFTTLLACQNQQYQHVRILRVATPQEQISQTQRFAKTLGLTAADIYHITVQP